MLWGFDGGQYTTPLVHAGNFRVNTIADVTAEDWDSLRRVHLPPRLACPSGCGSRGGSTSIGPGARRCWVSRDSPVVFKRSNEDGYDQRGLDLVTNFDFDRDQVFSNNKRNWEQVYRYIEGHGDVEHWRIRPTLYTALIEFMEADETKSVLLLYHVYHAKQIGSIHDWERVEIRIDDVYGVPGEGGERLNFVVIANHGTHKARKGPDADLNFMETDTGRHALIWQARWSGSVFEPNRAELRFVEDGWPVVSSNVEASGAAEVEVIDTSEKKNVNYVFVCDWRRPGTIGTPT